MSQLSPCLSHCGPNEPADSGPYSCDISAIGPLRFLRRAPSMTTEKYQPGEPADWKAKVGKLQLQESGGSSSRNRRRELVGPCPRCGHEIMADVSVISGPTMEAPGRETIKVVCNCTSFHEGAPAGTSGCGASGWVDIP